MGTRGCIPIAAAKPPTTGDRTVLQRSRNHGSHGQRLLPPRLPALPDQRRRRPEQNAGNGGRSYGTQREPPATPVPLLLRRGRSRGEREDGGLQHRHEADDAEPLRVPPRSCDSLIVGSQPQKPEDIDHLKDEEKVAYILCLQQDKDIEYWGIDFQAVVTRCKELGIQHMRRPAVDFDPDSLRTQLPKAVSALEWSISQGKGRVYIHCTAGLGRAPAVAISYMFWFENMDLNMAYDKLTSIRPCGPSKRAIRAATYDLAKSDPNKEVFEILPEHAFEGVSDSERKLIQDRVRALRKSGEGKRKTSG